MLVEQTHRSKVGAGRGAHSWPRGKRSPKLMRLFACSSPHLYGGWLLHKWEAGLEV